MTEIKQFSKGEYYFKIPAYWNISSEEWKVLPKHIGSILNKDATVYIDMEEVESMNSEIFNLLFGLAKSAAARQSNLIFTGAIEEIEERVALLGNFSE